uniref:Phytanoyl-CoA dioxygenase n=1 Tax=Alexandrium catenella TaxID=2925 RepID=A0A7S1QS60_ALECA|mmetsp:Transcript_37874/g.102534  ORF Transcript_37874/g.102534 Transcript_37874/m.102534 type:complete len:413 (+) Transcript_37874:44-1282(+)|eukprot:CAMPEP_0171196624 /NCGR_PEP_ID=MMETSP0790-20130122/21998_1 /TAXON_ID=2925 /ORGANISM="Alexandrium catenella, Strain OF101" /LENGTH=412 /DNA_ID=CAMNT_0011661853 /DNA_START=41 /DNA_END=1279 /DNA_ORIENTATION=-
MAPLPPTGPDPQATVFDPEDEEAYERFFHEHGYVVVRDVLDDAHVSATVDELWQSPSLLGAYPRLKRNDPQSWDDDQWPAGCRNFLDPLDPCSEVETWRNRVVPAVSRVFHTLWRGLRFDGEREDDVDGRLVVSVDRMGVMRPTKVKMPGKDGSAADDAPLTEKRDWRTSRNWLHWDQNPWVSPGFFAVQGILGLSEGGATSGGFVTVPGFHKEFAHWAQEHPEGSLPRVTRKTVPFSVPLTDEMQDRRLKVVVPRGGLLVWDSRMPHENFPNEDDQWRLCQYVTFKRLPTEGLGKRAAAWHAGIRTGLIPASFARRFSAEEHAILGMAPLEEQAKGLQEALEEGESLSPEALEAARKLRRAYRLKQIAMDPRELMEAKQLFQEAFAVNPRLKEPLQCVGAAEDSYLPFWIL